MACALGCDNAMLGQVCGSSGNLEPAAFPDWLQTLRLVVRDPEMAVSHTSLTVPTEACVKSMASLRPTGLEAVMVTGQNERQSRGQARGNELRMNFDIHRN